MDFPAVKVIKVCMRGSNSMISIIITAFKEPQTIGKAIEAVLKNKVKAEIIVAAPDKETAAVVKKYKQVKYFKDPGKGKSYALNLLFKKAKGEILILTDGDVYINQTAIKTINNAFKDKKVGCVTGRPIATNNKNTMLGFWSHLLLDAGAHRIRNTLSKQNKFLECSGYLFAFRNKIKKIPTDVAEDAYIPYLLWKQGYKIKYLPEAKVFVKYPNNLKEFIKQRVRTAKSHETLKKYAKDFPRVKSFWNEVFLGIGKALAYPKNLKEFIWTLLLFPTRLYMWFIVFLQTKIFRKTYKDAWERIESTKT